MLISEIKRVVDQVSRDRGIDKSVLITAIEEALKSAARKKYGNKIDIEINYNEESGDIEAFQFKKVVETVTDEITQISLKEGQKLDPECEIGDSLGTKMDTTAFGRIAAQSAKQVIIQKMKDAERNAVYSSFIDRKGEIINGIVQRIEHSGDIIVNLGQTEGILPIHEQIPKETYKRGERLRALLMDVLQDSRGPQIVLSRTHSNFLANLFKTEVPEISEGIVKIMGTVREPGVRAKIAVSSTDSDIHPVGACVGMKGSRVQNVVQELRGEKIDIIPWHVDSAKYVCNALAPAEIIRVIIDEDSHAMEVIVPDDSLSIAIGKRGQNVRLASKLTSWNIDVQGESHYDAVLKNGYDSLVSLPGVGINLANLLIEKGFTSVEEISNASASDLMEIKGIAKEKAEKLIDFAAEAISKGNDNNDNQSTEEENPDIDDNKSAEEENPDIGDIKSTKEENSDIGDIKSTEEENSDIDDNKSAEEENSDIGDIESTKEENSDIGDIKSTEEENSGIDNKNL